MSFLADLSTNIAEKFKKENPLIIYDPNRKVEAISSGSVLVDYAGGIGGLCAKGFISEIFGMESSGKTTTVLQTALENQKAGGVGVFLDYEHTFDASYAQKLGLVLDGETFIVFQPMYAEEGEEIINEITKRLGDLKKYPDARLDLLIIDSIAACRPRVQVTGESKQIGLHATYWSQFALRLQNNAARHHFAVFLTNQVRNAPDISGPYSAPALTDTGLANGMGKAGEGVTTTGGTALRFYLAMRFQLKFAGQIKEELEDEITGEVAEVRTANKSRITCIKNKLAPPFKQSVFAIGYGTGTNDTMVLEELLKTRGFISNKGANLTYEAMDSNLTYTAFGRKKFQEKFYSPEIQADAVLRFKSFIKEADPEKIKLELGETIKETVDASMIQVDFSEASAETPKTNEI